MGKEDFQPLFSPPPTSLIPLHSSLPSSTLRHRIPLSQPIFSQVTPDEYYRIVDVWRWNGTSIVCQIQYLPRCLCGDRV